jgi:rhodanese-related sulfurtransferase
MVTFLRGILFCNLLILFAMAMTSAAAEDSKIKTTDIAAKTVPKIEFPGRDLYPLVSIIELNELHRRFEEVTIVDVRSQYEYDTLRIKGAVNIPLSSPTFVEKMRELRVKESRPIVMYCNGKTCMKSYKAVLKCSVNKIENVHAFDAGIMDWARTYPKLAVLLGRNPVNPKHLISRDEFRKHLLSPDQYGDKVASTSAIVLDVRDRFQREGLSLFVGRERRAYLDDTKTLNRYINKAKRENKTLLVHDAAGKQVVWLQYYLKDKGLSKYYFMDGGTSAYYDQMKKEFVR